MKRLPAQLCVPLVLLALALPAEASAGVPRRLVVVGDSLGLYTVPPLQQGLPHWRIRDSTRPARRATDGPGLLRAYGRRLPPLVHVSLGTMDDPARPRRFRTSVGRVMRVAGRSRCVVWANIFRPVPRGEPNYTRLNRVLSDEDAARENLRVVDWSTMMRDNPQWMLGDAVHVTLEGYAARAQAVAAEVRHCRAFLASG